MRRFIAIVLLLCMIGSMELFAAESIEMLSYEDRQFYIANALSIQTMEHITISGNAYDWGSSGDYISSFGSGESTTEWIPYRGPSRISKADFFKLTGYDEFAKLEENITRQNQAYKTVAWSLIGTGLAIALGGYIWGVCDGFTNNSLGGIFMIVGGTVVSCVSIPFFCIETKSDISIQFAVGIANNYNQRLLESL